MQKSHFPELIVPVVPLLDGRPLERLFNVMLYNLQMNK